MQTIPFTLSGLAIAKYLTDIHGGTITATSAGIGHGTTFTVEIPLVTAQQAGIPGPAPTIQPSATEVSLKGLAILLVDDDTDTREMVSVVLENRKASVTPAESAPTALRLMDHRRFDVLVSDIGMPDTDGYAVLRLLRENGNAIPAVALTAFAGSDDREPRHRRRLRTSRAEAGGSGPSGHRGDRSQSAHLASRSVQRPQNLRHSSSFSATIGGLMTASRTFCDG